MTDRGRGSSRRSRLGTGTAAAVLLLAACTPPGLPAPISPASGSVHSGVPAAESQVTIGVDGAVQGFNPHAIADYSLADAAVAQLVLPSVSSVATDGTVALNTDVVRKAAVTSTDPFTVTYTLDRNAAWSDGTPITAEDFSYLWAAMSVQPGTIDPAGYRLITSIVSRDAGKTVEVAFKRPVPDWKSLFSPLLPSHILKDSPGGWAEGLAAGIPVSGNRYKMQGYEPVTGEITLVRNDKYWGTQPGPSLAVLRIGSSTALMEALGRGDLQAVFLQPDAADQRKLEAAVPAAHRVLVPLPGTIQLVFNTAQGAGADLGVRRAVAAALDLDGIRAALDGGNVAGGAPAPSLVSLPAAPVGRTAAATTSPSHGIAPGPGSPRPAVERAVAELAAVGYRRESLYMRKDGRILRLTLAYSGSDLRMAAAARLIQLQLAGVGIEVELLRDQTRAIVDSRLALGQVDLGLVMVPRGRSDGIAASSAFGCPPPITPPGGRDAAARAGNLSGYCSVPVQNRLDQATSGSVPGDLDGLLTAALPVLPISRPTAVFATSAAVAPVLSDAGPGWVFSGPLIGLARWPLG